MPELNPHLLGESKMLLVVLGKHLPKACAKCKVKGITPAEIIIELLLDLEDEGMSICSGAFAHIHDITSRGKNGDNHHDFSSSINSR